MVGTGLATGGVPGSNPGKGKLNVCYGWVRQGRCMLKVCLPLRDKGQECVLRTGTDCYQSCTTTELITQAK